MATAACTLEPQVAPGISGPSEFALSISLAATPDQLPRDGTAQAVVSVAARDALGHGVGNQRLSVVVSPFGAAATSATEVTTDGGGAARFLVTAPPAATIVPDNQLTVLVVPIGGNFANASPRALSIGLTGPSNTTAPAPAFTVTPAAPQVRQLVTFDASSTKDESVACLDLCAYNWNFDDGFIGSGRQVTHTFAVARVHIVALTVTDAAGAAASLRQAVNVSAVPAPSVSLAIGPVSPTAGQQATLTATASAAAGHSIQSYVWEFGDGTSQTTTTPTTTKTYGTAGDYTAGVTAVDDLGQAGSASLHFVVGAGITAAFTISPIDARVEDTVTFNAMGSRSSNGAAITRYVWDFGDGSPAATTSVPVIRHRFAAPRAYAVRLTVTDSQDRSATASQEVRITP